MTLRPPSLLPGAHSSTRAPRGTRGKRLAPPTPSATASSTALRPPARRSRSAPRSRSTRGRPEHWRQVSLGLPPHSTGNARGSSRTPGANTSARLRSLEALGHELARAALTQIGAPLALLLGDPTFAEREARLGEEILRRFDSAVLQAPLIAEAVAAQGRFAEAEAMLSEVSDVAGPPLPQWQVRLSIVQSRLASADRRFDEALDRAASAVRRSSETDDVNLRGDSHAALATALALAGDLDSALAERDAALAFYEQKENVAAARAFEAMFALSARPVQRRGQQLPKLTCEEYCRPSKQLGGKRHERLRVVRGGRGWLRTGGQTASPSALRRRTPEGGRRDPRRSSRAGSRSSFPSTSSTPVGGWIDGYRVKLTGGGS